MSNTCTICQKEFPARVVINDQTRYLYDRQYCLDCKPFGWGKRIDKYRVKNGVDQKRCKICLQWLELDAFGNKKNPSGNISKNPYCHTCNSNEVNQKRLALKRWAVEYCGGICHDCGIKDQHESIYDFHHLNPDAKDISMNRVSSKAQAKKLVSQCVLLCSNCHRLRHHDPNNPNYCPLKSISIKRNRSQYEYDH